MHFKKIAFILQLLYDNYCIMLIYFVMRGICIMKKRVVSFFLCIILCVAFIPLSAGAASIRNTSVEESLAVDLKALGLFQGGVRYKF